MPPALGRRHLTFPAFMADALLESAEMKLQTMGFRPYLSSSILPSVNSLEEAFGSTLNLPAQQCIARNHVDNSVNNIDNTHWMYL
jgi:hypothetical protein